MGEAYLLLLVVHILGGCTTFFCKKYTQLTSGSAHTGNLFYIVVMGILSLLSFWLMAGRQLRTDSWTLTFAIISAFIYVGLNTVGLFAYSKVNLVLLSIFMKSVTIVNWTCGVLFFQETPTVSNTASMLILCAAVFIPLMDLKHDKSNLRTTYLIGGIYLLLSSAYSIVMKIFLLGPEVDSPAVSSMLFFTHGLMSLLTVFILLGRRAKNPTAFKQEISVIRWPAIICIFLACLVGNPYSMLSSLVMQMLPLVQYSVLTAALESIVTFLVSKFIFKETVGKSTLIAFGLSTLAMIINAL